MHDRHLFFNMHDRHLFNMHFQLSCHLYRPNVRLRHQSTCFISASRVDCLRGGRLLQNQNEATIPFVTLDNVGA